MTAYFQDNYVGSGNVAGSTPIVAAAGSYANVSGVLGKSPAGVGYAQAGAVAYGPSSGAPVIPLSFKATMGFNFTSASESVEECFRVRIGCYASGVFFDAFVQSIGSSQFQAGITASYPTTATVLSAPFTPGAGLKTGIMNVRPGGAVFDIGGVEVVSTVPGFLTGYSPPNYVLLTATDRNTALTTLLIEDADALLANPFWIDFLNTYEVP